MALTAPWTIEERLVSFAFLIDLMLEAHFHGLNLEYATLRGEVWKRFGFAAARQIGRFRGQIIAKKGGRAR
jgi:hypothetical protein